MVEHVGVTDELIGIRHYLHQHPERSFKEVETSAYLARLLRGHGIDVLDTTLETGVVALIEGEVPGPRIALRADIDGLPITEDTGLPFSSLNPGVMHGCGHDMHTAMLLGAARLLMQHRQELSGTVKLVFQPDEEGFTASGALRMGVSEMTRFGFGQAEFTELAGLMADCILRGKDVGQEVSRLRSR